MAIAALVISLVALFVSVWGMITLLSFIKATSNFMKNLAKILEEAEKK